MMKPVPASNKSKRGRPASGKGDPVQVRLQPQQMSALDAWIASQPEPRPSRPEAIRRLLEQALASLEPPGTLDQQIARHERTLATNPISDAPSPATGVATLRRGLAETKLRALKARKAKKTPKKDDGR